MRILLLGDYFAEDFIPGTKYYEVPIAVQDRSFNANGSLFYSGTREFFDAFDGPYIPGSDVSPIGSVLIWSPAGRLQGSCMSN